jgi:proteasome activator subunit 3 (PA28 gamma)
MFLKGCRKILLNTFFSELQKLIASVNDPESPFNPSRSAETDPTVYPPPTSVEPPSKKRKLSGDDADSSDTSNSTSNDAQNARYPNLVVSNKRIKSMHEVIKKQCEELASSVVRPNALGMTEFAECDLLFRTR